MKQPPPLSLVGARARRSLYCRSAELLDWDILYTRTQALYSYTGQPLLDSVVFFELVLVG
jgi:hypothetical protein